jgi:translation initiation factor IF-3
LEIVTANTPHAHLMSLPSRPSGPRPNSPQNRGNFRRDPLDRGPKRNERIRVPEVRVVTAGGEMLGIMPTEKALQLAREQGVDLIEIAGTAVPPVCKLIEMGKYLYEEAKKSKHQKHTAKMKELKLRPRIDTHDLFIKIRRAENFLYHGHKVKLVLQYRFRDLEHAEIGVETVKRVISELTNVCTADNTPKRVGRSIVVGLTPLQQNRRKLVHNAEPGEEDMEDDSAVADEPDES